MTYRRPAQAFHISEILQYEMDARGWTRRDVYWRMSDEADCLAFDLLMDVKDKGLLMSKREAHVLAGVFGFDPEVLIHLHEGADGKLKKAD